MTEREKNEICKGYADLIINKTQQTRELWQTEIAIKRLEKIWTDQEREALRIIKEEKQTLTTNQTRPLVGQAAHVANLSLLLKDTKNGWDAQLWASYTGDKIRLS